MFNIVQVQNRNKVVNAGELEEHLGDCTVSPVLASHRTNA
jgi:hypothetical protein